MTFDQAEEAQDALVAHCDNILMQTWPTSFAGAVALARFAVDWFESQGVPLARDEYGTSVLRLIAAPFSPAEHLCANRRKVSTAAAAPQGGTEALRATVSRLPPPTRLDDVLDNARSYANEFDFSVFSIKDLAHLHDVARHAGTYWGNVGNMPLCNGFGADGSSLTSVGWFVEGEEQRLSFLRDRCVVEIAQRVPADDAERDVILCVRIAHEFDCNGRIDRREAPSLLIEALKAWG